MKTIVEKKYLKPEIKVIKIRQGHVLYTGSIEGDNDQSGSRTLKSSFEEEE